MIIRVYSALIDLLARLEQKLWPKNPLYSKLKNCRKSMRLPLTAFLPEKNCRELSIES